MSVPEIDERDRKRPLSYDPVRKKFILFDEIVTGEESIVSLDTLSDDDLRQLVIERWRALPNDIKVQAISGPPYSRDDVIRAIKDDELFGKITVQGEISYLRGLLDEIQRSLDEMGAVAHEPRPNGEDQNRDDSVEDAVDPEAGLRCKSEVDAADAAGLRAGRCPEGEDETADD